MTEPEIGMHSLAPGASLLLGLLTHILGPLAFAPGVETVPSGIEVSLGQTLWFHVQTSGSSDFGRN
jgi:hypothetical protein